MRARYDVGLILGKEGMKYTSIILPWLCTSRYRISTDSPLRGQRPTQFYVYKSDKDFDKSKLDKRKCSQKINYYKGKSCSSCKRITKRSPLNCKIGRGRGVSSLFFKITKEAKYDECLPFHTIFKGVDVFQGSFHK